MAEIEKFKCKLVTYDEITKWTLDVARQIQDCRCTPTVIIGLTRGGWIPARLLCVRDKKRKVDVWLLTNVVSSKQLPFSDASRFYRWRWENEGFFRTYKRTLAKVKLMCRTIREVHREAEASMIATQLLLAQGARALPKATSEEEPRVMCSPRKVLLEIRRELNRRLRLKRRGTFSDRLKECCREKRERSSPKATREWPRRKDHKPPGPPKILTLTAAHKRLISRIRKAA